MVIRRIFAGVVIMSLLAGIHFLTPARQSVERSLAAAAPAKSVTFLTLEGGAGHVMIENAFKEALKADPSAKNLTINSVFFNNFLTDTGKSVNDNYVWWAEHAPSVWDAMVDIFPRLVTKNQKRKFVRKSFHVKELAEAINKTHPDMIYCTHYTLAEIIDILQEDGLVKPSVKIVNQVTDYSVIRESLTRGLIIVPHPELKKQLVAMGKDPEMVKVVGGIPARPQFRVPYTTQEARVKLAQRLASEAGGVDMLGTSDPLIVASGGGDGRNVRFLADFLPEWHPTRPVKIAVICGKNEAVLNRVQALIASGTLDPKITVIPRGFEKQMDEFMKAADVIISKPGGSTTAEILALGKPLFAPSATGIQEKRNLAFLEKHGAAHSLKYPELNDMDRILSIAKSGEQAVRHEFPNARDVPNELVSVFNDYLSGRIASSMSEEDALAADIARKARGSLASRIIRTCAEIFSEIHP